MLKRLAWMGAYAAICCGCPKNIPQMELDAAESALADIDALRDCAPETALAAKTTMERAQALLKEERFEEAKTALIAAQKLAEKARRECDEKKKAQAEKPVAEPPPTEASRPVEAAPKAPLDLVTIFFGFNTSDLTDETRTALEQDAEYLRANAKLRVQIEGHCDERGSTEYNLALGERRALTVKQYLVKLGVEPNRMEIISYGEERPLDTATTEEAFSHNRRAEFRKLNP